MGSNPLSFARRGFRVSMNACAFRDLVFVMDSESLARLQFAALPARCKGELGRVQWAILRGQQL
jgi:hypothetical protein